MDNTAAAKDSSESARTGDTINLWSWLMVWFVGSGTMLIDLGLVLENVGRDKCESIPPFLFWGRMMYDPTAGISLSIVFSENLLTNK